MTTSNYKKKNQSSPLGGTEGGLMKPIKNRSAFFGHLQHGLQGYFDNHDRRFGGIIHFAIGVKNGRVMGIIRRDSPLPFAPKEYIGDGLYYEKRKTLPNPSLYGGVSREEKERKTNKKVRSNDNNE